MKLVVAAVIALALAAPALAGGTTPSQSDLEAEIVCPTCHTTLDRSDAPIARRMKAFIRERIAARASEEQIKRELVEQFGPAVLAEPPKRGFDLLAWVLPLGALALGVLGVGLLAWSWSRRRSGEEVEEEAPLEAELERRLDEELERFEA